MPSSSLTMTRTPRVPADAAHLLQAEEVDPFWYGATHTGEILMIAESTHLHGLGVEEHALIRVPRDATHAESDVRAVDDGAAISYGGANFVQVRPGNAPALGSGENERVLDC